VLFDLISTIDSVYDISFEQCGSGCKYERDTALCGIDTSATNAQPIGFDFNSNGLDEIFVNIKDSLRVQRSGNPIRVDMPNGFLR